MYQCLFGLVCVLMSIICCKKLGTILFISSGDCTIFPAEFTIIEIVVFYLLHLIWLARYFPDLFLYWKCVCLSCCIRNLVFLFMRSFSWNLYFRKSFWICAVGLFALMLSSVLIFCSKYVSCLPSIFFLYVEYDMIFPLNTTFPVSQSTDGGISGVSFISRKEATLF